MTEHFLSEKLPSAVSAETSHCYYRYESKPNKSLRSKRRVEIKNAEMPPTPRLDSGNGDSTLPRAEHD